jgi:hypothetical protein
MIKESIRVLGIFVSMLVFVSCNSSEKFKIEKGNVGHLNTQTTVQEFKKIFKNDSIVSSLSEGALGDNYFQDDDEYLIFEKGGKHLLTIIPKEQLDSTSTIKSIQIFDERYITESRLSLKSTFSEINANIKIAKIETSFSSAILFIDELNATITIDKDELGLKPFGTQKVVKEQIPDLAKIKSLIVWFN